jgi:hypothetical protein
MKSSGKPDGMFIRNDGLFTDNKNAAMLFNTIEELEDYLSIWRADYQWTLFAVEVEVKPVVQKVGRQVKQY